MQSFKIDLLITKSEANSLYAVLDDATQDDRHSSVSFLREIAIAILVELETRSNALDMSVSYKSFNVV